jgi:hypothetical protein
MNFIIKSRSLRYIAAAKEEWSYPDKHVSKSHWNTFGDGYLLMPDPRALVPGGDITIGYRDGTSRSFDPYGHRPWQPGFGQESSREKESGSLFRFQGEFARLYGPCRRGRSFAFDRLDNERDDDDFHQYHLRLDKQGKRRR